MTTNNTTTSADNSNHCSCTNKVYDRTKTKCKCWVCSDLEGQIKSLQKSDALTKQQIAKVIDLVKRVETILTN